MQAKFDVRELCYEIATAFQLQCRVGVNLAAADLPVCLIQGYRQGLLQIRANFTRNALKFTYQGSVIVGFEQKPGRLRLYIRDTGIGIPTQQQERIFERFVKLDTFTQGAGLGLSIYRSIAGQMGAKVGVDSKLGKGSCFHLDIPMEE